nr:hypothetical protein [Desulfoglaeba alkanexedens]
MPNHYMERIGEKRRFAVGDTLLGRITPCLENGNTAFVDFLQNGVGEKHKHRWTESFRDKEAYLPDDISATWDQPMEVRQQFCRKAKIEHRGQMHAPSALEELPL